MDTVATTATGKAPEQFVGIAAEPLAAEDDHVVRARIAHSLQQRGNVGDVVGVARRRVAGEAGFDAK
jgi:hypothetical protein